MGCEFPWIALQVLAKLLCHSNCRVSLFEPQSSCLGWCRPGDPCGAQTALMPAAGGTMVRITGRQRTQAPALCLLFFLVFWPHPVVLRADSCPHAGLTPGGVVGTIGVLGWNPGLPRARQARALL